MDGCPQVVDSRCGTCHSYSGRLSSTSRRVATTKDKRLRGQNSRAATFESDFFNSPRRAECDIAPVSVEQSPCRQQYMYRNDRANREGIFEERRCPGRSDSFSERPNWTTLRTRMTCATALAQSPIVMTAIVEVDDVSTRLDGLAHRNRNRNPNGRTARSSNGVAALTLPRLGSARLGE